MLRFRYQVYIYIPVPSKRDYTRFSRDLYIAPAVPVPAVLAGAVFLCNRFYIPIFLLVYYDIAVQFLLVYYGLPFRWFWFTVQFLYDYRELAVTNSIPTIPIGDRGYFSVVK